MGKKERIYELASGYFTKEVDHVVDEVEIQDEFHEGSTCSRLYEEMTELKKKVCEKLQVDEDCDLEHIIDCMSTGVIINNTTKITEGPLVGLEKYVKKIDRHKRLAWLEFLIGDNEQLTMQAGLEIISKC